MYLAAVCLPVPDSPEMRIGISRDATISMAALTLMLAGSATSNPLVFCSCRFRRSISSSCLSRVSSSSLTASISCDVVMTILILPSASSKIGTPVAMTCLPFLRCWSTLTVSFFFSTFSVLLSSKYPSSISSCTFRPTTLSTSSSLISMDAGLTNSTLPLPSLTKISTPRFSTMVL